MLQFVCNVVKDTGKEEYLRPFIRIGLDWTKIETRLVLSSLIVSLTVLLIPVDTRIIHRSHTLTLTASRCARIIVVQLSITITDHCDYYYY